MTALVIEPLDVLLFRDGKPFSAGADHVARSVFPPFPPTFAGFIRSRLYFEAGRDWNRARQRFGNVGGPSDYGDFVLRAAFVRKGQVDYVPTPLDCVTASDRGDGSPAMLAPVTKWPVSGLSTDFPDPQLRPLAASVPGRFQPAGGYVSLDELFRTILCGNHPAEVLPESSLVERETRTGIGVDRGRRVAQDELLYAVEFLRLKGDVGFSVVFDGVRWPGTSGVDTFGGERRPVRWSVDTSWRGPSFETIAERVAQHRRFKLTLLTPALFEPGWRPGARFNRILEDSGVKARMVGALVGRPALVGGFDLAAGAPKPIRSAAPAGSVYFYEIESGDARRLMNGWDLRTVSDIEWQVGMGVSALGAWVPLDRPGGPI